MDRHSEILDICAVAEHVFAQIPLEVADSREKHFASKNLWSLEIESTCSQIMQFYLACCLLVNQDLPRPAAALARAIEEACYRFKYLAENEWELEDWELWQIAQDYQLLNSFLLHDLSPDAEGRIASSVRWSGGSTCWMGHVRSAHIPGGVPARSFVP